LLSGREDELQKVSATNLAKNYGRTVKEVFARLQDMGYIFRRDNAKESDCPWELTELGKRKGGVILRNRFRAYIAWPPDIDLTGNVEETVDRSKGMFQ